MYNKLFTKILDSSIWLEPMHVRIVWVTFIACMDQDGVVSLSGVGNVAARARVTEEEAEFAINCLMSKDTRNPDQEYDGRRIERIPGIGWKVINAKKYRDIITAETMRAQTRERVRRYRCNAHVTLCNENVTLSEAEAEAFAAASCGVRLLVKIGVTKAKAAEFSGVPSMKILSLWLSTIEDAKVNKPLGMLLKKLRDGDDAPPLTPDMVSKAANIGLISAISIGDKHWKLNGNIRHNASGLYIDGKLAVPTDRISDCEVSP